MIQKNEKVEPSSPAGSPEVEKEQKEQAKEPLKPSTLDKNAQTFQDQQLMKFEDGFKVKFKPYSDLINNLTKMHPMETDEQDLVYCTISTNSKRILTVSMADDEHYNVTMYDADNLKRVWQRELRGNHIKAKEIAMNQDGTIYICPYFNSGQFNLLVFDEQKELYDYSLNADLNLDNQSRPNDNFQDPLINCAFLHDQFSNQVFVNIYYTPNQTMKYFRFSIVTKEITTDVVDFKCEETTRNFPLTSIYDSFRHYCYVFFRQGMSYMIDMDSL